MRNTPQEIIPLVQAELEGKEIHYRFVETDTWLTKSKGAFWNFQNIEYRIAPEPEPPKLWDCIEDVRPGFLRTKGQIESGWSIVIGCNRSGVECCIFNRLETVPWLILNAVEYSTDLLNWGPPIKQDLITGNPWIKESLNLESQARISREFPDHAKRLKKAAGVES